MISYQSPRGQNQSGARGTPPVLLQQADRHLAAGGSPEPTSIFHALKDVAGEMLSPTISFTQAPFLWLMLVCVLSLYAWILEVLPVSRRT